MTRVHAIRVARSLPCKRIGKTQSGSTASAEKRRSHPQKKLSAASNKCALRKSRGNAIVEVLAALLALLPFLFGMPLLGKHFDIEHKCLDAARYAVWERTIWRNAGADNRKDEQDIALESRDRSFGNSTAGLVSAARLRSAGITENALWRDRRGEPLIAYHGNVAPIMIEQEQRVTPLEVGHSIVPGLTHGNGASRAIEASLGVSDLRLARDTLARADVAVALRGIVTQSTQILQRASAAVLSDTWSASDETGLGRRVDALTTDELIQSLEWPGRLIAMQASGKGQPLYGEGQFASEPDLRPASSTLPAAYVKRK